MTGGTVIIETNRNSDYSLQLNRWLLKPIGGWPHSSSTTIRERIIAIILNIICFGLMLFGMVPGILHIILEDESFYNKMKVLCFVVHWIIGGINYTILLLRRKGLRNCVDQVKYDWSTVTRKKDQHVMLKNAKFGRYVVIFCTLIYHGSVMSYCMLIALATDVIEVGNETKIVHMLPCAVYKKLMVVDESPTYEIVLTSQIVAIAAMNFCVIGILGLAAVLAAHACGQLNVLMTWITEYVNEPDMEDKTNPFKKMSAIVEHHIKILDFISHIEETMNWTWFMELFRCILAITVLGYYTLVEWADGETGNLVVYFILGIAIIFNTFVICYVGDLLTEQCRRVGAVVYMTNWYYLPAERIHDLMFIITRSNVMVELTAGRLIQMSVYTFSDVVKTGFAYLNLLSQLVV